MRKKWDKVIFYIVLGILSIIWLAPVFFIAITALKSPQDFYMRGVFALPEELQFGNFVKAWTQGNLARYMLNSLIVSCLKVPLGVLLVAGGAFCIVRLLPRRAGSLVFTFILIGMMIPHQVAIIPLNIALSNLGLINTYVGLFIVYLGFGIPFGILVMRGFIRTIPVEIDEAAIIDGCTNYRLFWSIILPMAKPALSTLVIMDYLATWNEYILASVFITDSNIRTVPTGIMSFIGLYGADYGLLNAGVLISIIPVLVIYVVFQKHFVQGMAGAVKG